jgi:tetratricopeptide (TPR) repeat protein
MWALGLVVTFVLVIIKIASPNYLPSARVEYMLISLIVFLIIPYLGKLEAFGIKVETRKRVDEVEVKLDAIDTRLKALPDYIMGSDYFNEEDYQLAKECYLKSLQADPTFWPAEFCLGSIYQSQGRHEDAIRSYKKILEEDPDNVYALNNLAESYLYAPPPLKNPEKALKCADRILSILDGMGSALQYKCEALNRLGRSSEASGILKQLIKNDTLPSQKHWVLYELALANSMAGIRLSQEQISRIYEIALSNGEGEYFLEEAKKEVDLFDSADGQILLKFINERKEAEESIQ